MNVRWLTVTRRRRRNWLHLRRVTDSKLVRTSSLLLWATTLLSLSTEAGRGTSTALRRYLCTLHKKGEDIQGLFAVYTMTSLLIRAGMTRRCTFGLHRSVSYS